MNTLAFLAQQGLQEGLDRGVHFEPLAKPRRSYVTNFVFTQAVERIKTEKNRQNAAANSVLAVNTLAFSTPQGLLDDLDGFVHFEPLAKSRRSDVTNAVALQAAERAGTANPPSERCRSVSRGEYASVFRVAMLT